MWRLRYALRRGRARLSRIASRSALGAALRRAFPLLGGTALLMALAWNAWTNPGVAGKALQAAGGAVSRWAAAGWSFATGQLYLRLDAGAGRSLLEIALPARARGSDGPEPEGSWRTPLRAWVYVLTGYDFARPHTFLESEAAGFKAALRNRMDVARVPEPGSPGGTSGRSVPAAPESAAAPGSPAALQIAQIRSDGTHREQEEAAAGRVVPGERVAPGEQANSEDPAPRADQAAPTDPVETGEMLSEKQAPGTSSGAEVEAGGPAAGETGGGPVVDDRMIGVSAARTAEAGTQGPGTPPGAPPAAGGSPQSGAEADRGAGAESEPRPREAESSLPLPQGVPPALAALAREPWGSEPLVLIVHSHTSESYRTIPPDPRATPQNHVYDSNDTGIVRVGRALAEKLEREYNIPSIHSTRVHNWPHHARAYLNSRETVREILREHPSIKVVLDIHRQGVPDFTYATTVSGVDAVGIEIIYTTGLRASYPNPHWTLNEAFANQLSRAMSEVHPGLLRRVMRVDDSVYNQDLHPRMLLLEIGNYLDLEEHAIAAAQLLADSLARVLFDILAEEQGQADAPALGRAVVSLPTRRPVPALRPAD